MSYFERLCSCCVKSCRISLLFRLHIHTISKSLIEISWGTCEIPTSHYAINFGFILTFWMIYLNDSVTPLRTTFIIVNLILRFFRTIWDNVTVACRKHTKDNNVFSSLKRRWFQEVNCAPFMASILSVQ